MSSPMRKRRRKIDHSAAHLSRPAEGETEEDTVYDNLNDDMLARRAAIIAAMRAEGWTHVVVSARMVAQAMGVEAEIVARTVHRYRAYFQRVIPPDIRIPKELRKLKSVLFMLHPHIAND